jgi:hypothetical protein
MREHAVNQRQLAGSIGGHESSTALDPMFVWIELNRRVDALVGRVNGLDEHGSRGVDVLRVELAQLRKDLGDHEELHRQAEANQRTLRQWAIGLVIVGILALVSNPFLVYWLTHRG